MKNLKRVISFLLIFILTGAICNITVFANRQLSLEQTKSFNELKEIYNKNKNADADADADVSLSSFEDREFDGCYGNQLSADAKAIYDGIVASIEDSKDGKTALGKEINDDVNNEDIDYLKRITYIPNITIDEIEKDESKITFVYEAIAAFNYDYPEVFWIYWNNTKVNVYSDLANNDAVGFSIIPEYENYYTNLYSCKEDVEKDIVLMNEEVNKISDAVKDMNPYCKLKYFNNYIVDKVEYNKIIDASNSQNLFDSKNFDASDDEMIVSESAVSDSMLDENLNNTTTAKKQNDTNLKKGFISFKDVKQRYIAENNVSLDEFENKEYNINYGEQLSYDAKAIYNSFVECIDVSKDGVSQIGLQAYENDPQSRYTVIDGKTVDMLNSKGGTDFFYEGIVAFDYDYPDVFWLNYDNIGFLYTYYETGEITDFCIVPVDGEKNYFAEIYNSKEDVEKDVNILNQEVQNVLDAVQGKTIYEKLKYFNSYIVDKVEYNRYVKDSTVDVENTENGSNKNDVIEDVKLSDNPSNPRYNCTSVFIYGNTDHTNQLNPVCEGYSRAFKLLCNKLNVNCVIVSGGGHMWNYVKIPNVFEWYGVDVTWNDPVFNGIPTEEDIERYKYKYFLLGADSFFNGGGELNLRKHTEEYDGVVYENIKGIKYPTLSKNDFVIPKIEDFNYIPATSTSVFVYGNTDHLNKFNPICEGYSKAFKILCNKNGIECVLAVSADHMWNYVKMPDNQKWYGVDVTWNDPTINTEISESMRESLKWKYFLKGSENFLNKDGEIDEDKHTEEPNSLGGYKLTNVHFPVLAEKDYFIYGDIDDDGTLTVNDAKKLLELILNGGLNDKYDNVLSYRQNRNVTAVDVSIILNAALGQIDLNEYTSETN